MLNSLSLDKTYPGGLQFITIPIIEMCCSPQPQATQYKIQTETR